MAWKPKTKLGKILKGAVIGIGIAGAAIGGAAILAGSGGAVAPAVVSAGGGLFSKLFKGAKKVVDVVGTKAKDMVTGVTAQARELIKEQKKEARADMQDLTAIDKLVRAGATVEEAAAKMGVPLSALKGFFGIPTEGETEAELIMTAAKEPEVVRKDNKMLIYAGLGLAGLFLLPKLLKGR